MKYIPPVGTVGAMAWLLCFAAACTQAASSEPPCTKEERTLDFGFYAYYEPVSYSADGDAGAPGFDRHRGYEADLLTALEAMDPKLSFSRRGIEAWSGIWLLPAGPRFDIVGGGITILDSRTRDPSGRTAVVFTSGHIEFRQSLLVRAEDAERFARHRDLTSADRVGVLAGTTGEARLLVLTGLADGDGVLAAGTRVDTPAGTVVADGSVAYAINAAGASPALTGRQALRPASDTLPTVVYFAEDPASIKALAAGSIDAIARGEVGNRAEVRVHGDAFAVTALDRQVEQGGFALAVEDAGLAACLDHHIGWLTDGGRIGYREWLDDPTVFLRRARQPVAGESH